MKWLIGIAAVHPRQVLIVLLALTVLAASLVPRIEVRISTESMMAEEGPGRETHEDNVRTFGSSSSVIVYIRDPDLFDLDTLRAVRSVVVALEKLPFVEGTDSLFTLTRGRLSEGGTVEFPPYLDPLPATVDAVAAIRAEAWADAFAAGNLLSADGHTMAINVRLKARYRDRAVVDGVEAVLAPLRGFAGEVFALGQPHVNVSISDHIVRDQVIILPLSLAVLLLALLFALGRWEGILLPLLTATASVIWTLAFMAVLDISLNVMTSVAPLLLVVVGSTEDVHLLAAYYARMREGMDARSAIDAMAASTGLAVLLTFATTYLGFLAIMLNDIGLLREFGLVASTGLLFNFVITSLLVPAALALRKPGSVTRRPETDRYQRMARWLHGVACRRRVTVAAVAVILFVAAAVGALQLRVNNNVMDYFPTDSPIIGQSQRLHQELAGIQSFDVVLASGIEGTFERIRYLGDVERLQRFIDETDRFDKTQSFVDLLKEVNRVMQGLSPGELYLPEDDAVVREFLLFLDQSSRSAYVSNDLSRTRITVRHNITSSRELKQAVAAIEEFAKANIESGLDVTVSGESILTQRAGDALAAGQAKSLVLIVAAIFLIVTAIFVNWKAGALAVVPNVLPIMILFGVMGFAGIPLSTGTAMVAAIAVGICVDDTIHFLMRYHQEIAVQPTTEEAIRAAMEEEARPIMSTTAALTLGFGVLALSSFPPVVHFGLLAALVFVLALVSTFVVTPILLSYVRLVTLWDVLGVQVKSRLMDECILFRGMHPFQVRKLIAMSSRRTFEVGEKIVQEGDDSQELFVILHGQVRAQRRGTGGELEILNTMQVGEVFGEIALTANTVRTADVVTLERTEVLVLRWTDLQALARYMPRTSSRLLLNIASGMGQRLISRHF